MCFYVYLLICGVAFSLHHAFHFIEIDQILSKTNLLLMKWLDLILWKMYPQFN